MNTCECDECRKYVYQREQEERKLWEADSPTNPLDLLVRTPSFELVQVHEMNGYAEIVVRDRNNRKVYAGNMKLVDNPNAYYPAE